MSRRIHRAGVAVRSVFPPLAPLAPSVSATLLNDVVPEHGAEDEVLFVGVVSHVVFADRPDDLHTRDVTEENIDLAAADVVGRQHGAAVDAAHPEGAVARDHHAVGAHGEGVRAEGDAGARVEAAFVVMRNKY